MNNIDIDRINESRLVYEEGHYEQRRYRQN